MLPEEIPVASRKHIETFRESIAPRSQDEVIGIVTSLLVIARKGHVNGSILLPLSQGGVRSIVVESVEESERK